VFLLGEAAVLLHRDASARWFEQYRTLPDGAEVQAVVPDCR
jgi:hypothetical protein